MISFTNICLFYQFKFYIMFCMDLIQLIIQNPTSFNMSKSMFVDYLFLPTTTISSVQFSSIQSLSRVQLFATPWTTACQASLSITNSQSLPKPMSMELVMPSNHLILVVPFSSCPPSFPASESFPVSQHLLNTLSASHDSRYWSIWMHRTVFKWRSLVSTGKV